MQADFYMRICMRSTINTVTDCVPDMMPWYGQKRRAYCSRLRIAVPGADHELFTPAVLFCTAVLLYSCTDARMPEAFTLLSRCIAAFCFVLQESFFLCCFFAVQ